MGRMTQPIIGLGAGGHAKVVIEILRLTGQYNFIGLLDMRRELWGTQVLDVPVLGDDSMLPKIQSQGVRDAFIGVGAAGDTRPRQQVFESLQSAGFRIVSVVHPGATLSPSARVGPGLSIMAGAVVNASVRIGKNVIVNTGAIIEHDCVIGNHVHIATGARLGGNVTVGAGTHIGLGGCVRQGIRIGRHVIVGAGAVAINDIPDNLVVAGVPARELMKS